MTKVCSKQGNTKHTSNLIPGYSLLQLEPTFGGFPYKMPYFRGVENHLNVMQNPPKLFQLLALMWEASEWVLVPKFLVVLDLQALNLESTKKVSFSKENQKSKS